MRAYPTPGLAAAAALALVALALGACSTATYEGNSPVLGAYKVSTSRMLTDTALGLDASGGGLRLDYTSKPNDAAAARAFDAADKALGLAAAALRANPAAGSAPALLAGGALAAPDATPAP